MAAGKKKPAKKSGFGGKRAAPFGAKEEKNEKKGSESKAVEKKEAAKKGK